MASPGHREHILDGSLVAAGVGSAVSARDASTWWSTSAAVVPLRGTYEVWSPAIVAVGERWVQLWQQSGLPEPDANRAAIVSAMAVLGVIEQETRSEPFDPPEDEPLLTQRPQLRAVLDAPPRDLTDDFELLVRGLVDGLYTRMGGR